MASNLALEANGEPRRSQVHEGNLPCTLFSVSEVRIIWISFIGLVLSRREALPLVAACSFSPNRNRLLPISITLKVPKSGRPDFGGGERRDERGGTLVTSAQRY